MTEPEPVGGPHREAGFGGAGDAFYEALLAAHHGLSDDESAALDARLVLILAHEVGDLAVLREALRVGRASLRPADEKHPGERA